MGCRARREEPRAVALHEADARSPERKEVRLTTAASTAGWFAGPQRLVLTNESNEFHMLDFADAGALRLLEHPPFQSDYHWLLLEGDVWGLLWYGADPRKPVSVLHQSVADGPPKLLASFSLFPEGLRLDDDEVYVSWADKSYCASCSPKAEVRAVSRNGKGSRLLVSAGELISFDLDDTDVYWLEGLHDSVVKRTPKRGGPTTLVGRPGQQGYVFALRDRLVHVDFGRNSTKVAAKTTGSFTEANVDLRDAFLVHDCADLCWIAHPHVCDDAGSCTTDPDKREPQIRCWNGSAAPRTFALTREPTWLALSPDRIAFGAADGVFTVARPK